MDGRRHRIRAVSLTESARQQLQAAVAEQCRNRFPGKKLTRERRAEIVGLSIGTADRVFQGKGVDRPSLMAAFLEVGIPWDDSYCVPAEAAPAGAIDPPEAAAKDGSSWNRRWLIGIGATALAIGAIALAAGALGIFLPRRQPPDLTYKAQVHLQMGSDAYHAGRYEEAESEIRTALDLARSQRDAGLLASSLRMLGDLYGAKGRYEESRRAYLEALTLRSAFGDRVSEPAIKEALGAVETKLGQFESAERHLVASAAGYGENNDPNGVAMALRSHAALELARGRNAEARARIQSAQKALKGSQAPDLQADLEGLLAVVEHREGRGPAARQRLERVLRHWQGRRHLRWIATTRLRLGTLEADGGDRTAARTHFLEAERLFTQVGDLGGVEDTRSAMRKALGPAENGAPPAGQFEKR